MLCLVNNKSTTRAGGRFTIFMEAAVAMRYGKILYVLNYTVLESNVSEYKCESWCIFFLS